MLSREQLLTDSGMKAVMDKLTYDEERVLLICINHILAKREAEVRKSERERCVKMLKDIDMAVASLPYPADFCEAVSDMLHEAIGEVKEL